MSETGLICWNCLARTPPGECIHCQALVKDPNIPDEEEEEDVEEDFFLVSINQKTTLQIYNSDVEQAVGNSFEIKRKIKDYRNNNVSYIVTQPKTGLEEKFEQLSMDSKEIAPGLTPRIAPVDSSNDIHVSFYYFLKGSSYYRFEMVLILFSLFSILLAGILNVNRIYEGNNNANISGFAIFGININFQILLHALLFTGVLVLILATKDSYFFQRIFRKDTKLRILYLPAPPIFELGTLGSFHVQEKKHKDKKELLHHILFGPILAWIFAFAIVIVTMPFSDFSPSGVEYYEEYSIVYNNKFEPIGLRLGVMLSNLLGLSNIDSSVPFTQNYLVHPMTLGALIGLYLTAFQLLPLSHWNGGLVVRALFGPRVYGLLHNLTIIAIVFYDWFFALFLFLISIQLDRAPQMRVGFLNELSKPPRTKYLYVLIIVILIILSIPLPIDLIYP